MNLAIGIIVGIISGIGITLLVIRIKAQSLMLHENKSIYGFAETEEIIAKAVAGAGWKMPKVHDLQETMTNNGYSVRPVRVIEICKPSYAFQILEKSEERIASSLMPCRIAIYEKADGKVYVSRMNAGLLGSLMNGVIPGMMSKAAEETEMIIKSVITE